jgi:hypothetical protein
LYFYIAAVEICSRSEARKKSGLQIPIVKAARQKAKLSANIEKPQKYLRRHVFL